MQTYEIKSDCRKQPDFQDHAAKLASGGYRHLEFTLDSDVPDPDQYYNDVEEFFAKLSTFQVDDLFLTLELEGVQDENLFMAICRYLGELDTLQVEGIFAKRTEPAIAELMRVGRIRDIHFAVVDWEYLAFDEEVCLALTGSLCQHPNPHLEALSLTALNLEPGSVTNLARALPRLPALKEFALTTRDVSREELQEIVNSVPRARHLVDLNFNAIQDPHFMDYFVDMLQRNRLELTKLALVEIDRVSLAQFKGVMEHLPTSIESLFITNVDHHDEGVDGEYFNALWHAVRCYPRLVNIDISPEFLGGLGVWDKICQEKNRAHSHRVNTLVFLEHARSMGELKFPKEILKKLQTIFF